MRNAFVFSFTVAIFAVAFSAQAQTRPAAAKSKVPVQTVMPERTGIKVEPQLGLNFMSISGPDSRSKMNDGREFKYEAGAGHSIGVGAAMGVSPTMMVETGVHYVRSNFKSNTLTSSNGSTTVKVHGEIEMEHLAVPLLGSYCFTGCASSSFFVKGGAIPTYFLGGRSRSVAEYSGFGRNVTEKNSERFDDSDVTGLNVLGSVGGGYRFQFNDQMGLVLDGNFVHSLFKLGGDVHAYQYGLWTGAHLSVNL